MDKRFAGILESMPGYYNVDVESIEAKLDPKTKEQLGLEPDDTLDWETMENGLLDDYDLKKVDNQDKLTYEGDGLEMIFRPRSVILRDYREETITKEDLRILEIGYRFTGNNLKIPSQK